MSTINVSNLILTLQQKIDSSTNETDLLYYSKAMQHLRTGNIFTVNSVSNLPAAQQNLGSLYYVRDDEFVYFATQFDWVPFYFSAVNTIFSWGSNYRSRLGDGTATDSCSPVREFCSATDWCHVSAGGFHSAAIKTSGEIWSWGCGNSGRLGDGTTTNRTSPVREFCSATDWCQVSAGTCHTGAIKSSGELWAWGQNGFEGRLGDGTETDRCSPVREFCSATNWCQVSAGSDHTAAVKTSGEIWSWGRGTYGILGDGTVTDRCSPVREISSSTDWCQVSAGKDRNNTVAIKTSGQIWTWGRGTSGLIGDGTTINRCSPVREFCSATDWCQVSVGAANTSAIKTSGQLWSWGSNSCGRLGDGTITNSCSPVREFCSATNWCQVSAGCVHTAAIRTKTL